MKTIIAAALLLLVAVPIFAAHVPEIDPSGLGSGLALIGGSLLVLKTRK